MHSTRGAASPEEDSQWTTAVAPALAQPSGTPLSLRVCMYVFPCLCLPVCMQGCMPVCIVLRVFVFVCLGFSVLVSRWSYVCYHCLDGVFPYRVSSLFKSSQYARLSRTLCSSSLPQSFFHSLSLPQEDRAVKRTLPVAEEMGTSRKRAFPAGWLTPDDSFGSAALGAWKRARTCLCVGCGDACVGAVDNRPCPPFGIPRVCVV